MNARDIETIPAADAFMVADWVRDGIFADLDAAWDAYQQWGSLGFLFGEGAQHEPHTPPVDTPSGPEFPGAMRAWQPPYIPPMARR